MIKAGIKIAISGKSGCGNTTLSRLLAQRFNLRLINYTFRNMAQEMGLELGDLLAMADKDPHWDKELDARQVNLAAEGNCVLGSRLAIWVLKDADLRIYLKADAKIRAERICQRQGGVEEEVYRETVERDERDRERYLRLYKIDNDIFNFADLVLDSGALKPETLEQIIVQELQKRRLL